MEPPRDAPEEATLVPTEGQRAARALVLGGVLGAVLALIGRRRAG